MYKIKDFVTQQTQQQQKKFKLFQYPRANFLFSKQTEKIYLLNFKFLEHLSSYGISETSFMDNLMKGTSMKGTPMIQ